MAVIGAGNVGQAISGHMTQRGHEVRMYSAFPAEFDPIIDRGGIELSGAAEGTALPAVLSSDLAECVDGADVVVVAVPAFAHRDVSQRLADIVEPEQLVLFQPSALGSGLELARSLDLVGRKPCLIAETGTSLYTCRLHGPAQVYIGSIKPRVRIGATPSVAVEEARRRLELYFDDRYEEESDALTVGLSRIGAVYHVPPALFNFSSVENREGLPHNTLATPRIAALIAAIDSERLALSAALDVRAVSFPEFLERSYGVTEGTLSERIQKSYGPLNFPEPDSPAHRYFTEDIPFSMVTWSSLAARIGCPMPITDAVIDTSAILCDQDWRADARTVETLGLAEADAAQIRSAFLTGRTEAS